MGFRDGGFGIRVFELTGGLKGLKAGLSFGRGIFVVES